MTNVIAQGVALDLGKLFKELDTLTALRRSRPEPSHLRQGPVSSCPIHILQDELEEGRLGTAGFGSTKCGIAPFYSDKYAKIGIQVCELFDKEQLEKRLAKNVAVKNKLFETLYPGAPVLDTEAIMEYLCGFTERLAPMVGDVAELLSSAVKSRQKDTA